MKKLSLFFVILAVLCFSSFAEEIDFLLFYADSSDQFADPQQAMIHLDNVARYLLDRNLRPGQVHVDGYAAAAANDIDAVELSRNRALFVIDALQKRGVPQHVFADPEAFGSVAFWGANADENTRTQNRRVRIYVDGYFIPPNVIHLAPDLGNNQGGVLPETTTFRFIFSSILLFTLIILVLIISLIVLSVFLTTKYLTGKYQTEKEVLEHTVVN
jgi:hypothetical protein